MKSTAVDIENSNICIKVKPMKTRNCSVLHLAQSFPAAFPIIMVRIAPEKNSKAV